MASDEIEYLVKLRDTETREESDPISGPSPFEAGRKAAEESVKTTATWR